MQIWDRRTEGFASFGDSNAGNERLIKVRGKKGVVGNIQLYISKGPAWARSSKGSGERDCPCISRSPFLLCKVS